ncbi:MAG TPA: tRNA pseudouridine(55) synthase TruB [Bryobacteraceae bacterium]|nr:tRNA pseudouridine(55) synthase TruB [Bryobacteraceae bacterium]
MDGVIVVDKPQGCTSHDVVNRVRRWSGTRRVGHLGTLDPMATGVLPLVIGKATRLAQFYLQSSKRYEACIHFGYSTDSYDRDGQPTSTVTDVTIDPAELEKALERFRGTIEQTPPPFSAKKISGTPAYSLVRKHLPVDLKPVQITTYSFELLGVGGNEARVRIHCSAGTYLRSIAHELGQIFGCGAFLAALRRTASGEFTEETARTLEQLGELAEQSRLNEALIPAARLLPEFPDETVDSVTAGQIRNGRDFRVSPFRTRSGSRFVKAVSPDGDLVAIGEAKLPNLYHPVLVL